MPLETGGRADKFGNLYEIRCIIYELLKVIREDNYSITIEAVGEDEAGTDILVCKKDGTIEHQQCKVRNASKEYWTLADLNSRKIFKSWLNQLNRDDERTVAITSPIGCSFLVDLHNRAMTASENTEMFYKWQIEESDTSFVNAYKDFCKYMNLDYTKPEDVQKSVAYLKRINFYHLPEAFYREANYRMIDFLFSSDYQIVYNALVCFIEEGDILGKEITAIILRNYFHAQKISFRLMDNEPGVFQRIESLNKEFCFGFSPINGTLIKRSEFGKCIDAIKEQKHLIISGNAGYGKSGCVKAIIDFCEEEKIPYIALKLDRRLPRGNSEMWGRELGLPGSIPYVLNVISQHEQAVLLLDQLDALRWTQSNSSEALQVCMELIEQTNHVNFSREKKISIVFVCRTYDLNNDNNIKSLFKSNRSKIVSEIEWEKVNVQLLDEDTVTRIVGEAYSRLTTKTKTLLRMPSNLFVWTHLDYDFLRTDYNTTNGLIGEWFEQTCKKSRNVGIDDKIIKESVEEIVSIMDNRGCLSIPKNILKCGETGIDYLVSAEILIIDRHTICFTHQSILDYFISNRMTEKYIGFKDMEEIVGEKARQTPAKRYQVQMFMQNLFEYNFDDFISAGKQLIESEKIRHYVKFVFYELLGQIEEPNEVLEEFIVEYCDHVTYGKYLLNNVFLANSMYFSLLKRNGIIDRWMKDEEKKNNVFMLLSNMAPNLDSESINFIKEYAFKNEDDDKMFSRCFLHDITSESNDLFDLRLQFYDKYPTWISDLYVDIKKCFALCEARIIKLLSFWLQNKDNIEKKKPGGCNEIFTNNGAFAVKDGQNALDELLRFIPQDSAEDICHTDWSCRRYDTFTLERLIVEIIKKANKSIIDKDPNLFWQYYKPYMGRNYAIFNELILDAFRFFPLAYSDDIIHYLSSDINSNVFDETSNNKNKLLLTEEVIKKHTLHCKYECLEVLEKAIQNYVSPNAVKWYEDRIEYNKTRTSEPVYWSFWGDLQLQLLSSISQNRLSEKSKSLLNVLQRRFAGDTSRYNHVSGMQHGNVTSPISKKEIGKKQWLKIMQNSKLKTRKHALWKENEGEFVESSLEMYVSDFHSAVGRNPNEMIGLVIDNKDSIPASYIDSMFSGAAFSERKDTVSQEMWEKMFKCFPCDMESQRAHYFCTIIEKIPCYHWSYDVLVQLKQIATDFRGLELKENDLDKIDSDSLFHNSLNNVRGHAAMAIGHLLWEKKELLETFKETIDLMCLDCNPAVQMATLFALWPSYNIDREWAADRILRLYETDIRKVAFRGSKDMFFLLYPKYTERVIKVILRCFNSEDTCLIEVSGHSICELYLREGEFSDIFSNLEELSELQIKAILEMAVLYLNLDAHRDEAKEIILSCKNCNYDVEFPLSRMFYDKLVDVGRDSDFLLEIMSGKVNRRIIYAFTHFLEENARSVKDFADIIIALCENVLRLEVEERERQWGIETQISKLIIALYDECANKMSHREKVIADKCLDLWDIMFEKQVGHTRYLSHELMER